MASVMLKSFKFAKILNGRLVFSFKKPNIISGQCFRSYQQSSETKASATLAYELEPNEEAVEKNSVVASKAFKKNIDSLDDGLSKIDYLVKGVGRTQMKNVNEIVSLITSKEMTSSTHGLFLIRSCKYCLDEHPTKRINLVNEIWNKYQGLGIEFDVRHYNSLLDVHISNGFNFNPGKILASMEDSNIKPDKGTYLLIMKKYCQDGNIEGASEILQYMKKEGLSADEKVFNYLIEGHVKNNDFAGAKDMIEVMRTSNLQLTADTYSILACGHAANGEKDQMMSYLKLYGKVHSAENYLKVIDALATSGNHQYVDEVLLMIENKVWHQQEIMNAAIELIHKDQFDIAYKLAIAARQPNYNDTTIIFIKQLIKGCKPVSSVMEYCQRLVDEGVNTNIYLHASRIACDNGLLDYAIPLFKKLVETGYCLRDKNFWPLFRSSNVQKSPEDVWLILKAMADFGVPADISTYDVLFSVIGLHKPEYFLENVKRSGQIVQNATDCLFIYYCDLGEFHYAEELIKNYPVNVRSKFNINDFLEKSANLGRDEYSNYLKILKHLFAESKNYEFQGILLAQLVLAKLNVLEALLQRHNDLKLSQEVLNICEMYVHEKNPSKKAYVRQLRRLNSQRRSMTLEDISIAEEDDQIRHLLAQNIPVRPFLMKRVLHHIRTKNIARASELLPLFEKLKLENSPIIYSSLLSGYCNVGDVEKATESFNKLTAEFPSFKLDFFRSLNYVHCLLKYGKLDESYETLKNFLKEPIDYLNKEGIVSYMRIFNRTLADINDLEFVKKMETLLFSLSEEFGSKKTLLEPSVFYHLQRNDLSSALEEFRNAVIKHRTPVCLSLFLRKCINMDDKNTLQKVIDLSISCSRKSTVLLELAVVFIETAKFQDAVRIIQSISKEIDPKDMDSICQKLVAQNKLDDLEKLIVITKSLSLGNRENLYLHALKACVAKNDFERAKKIYSNLKSEVSELSSETTSLMQEIEAKEYQSESTAKFSDTSENISPSIDAIKNFIRHLEASNVKEALDELSTLKKGYIRTLSIENMTDLIDLCLQKHCTNDLSLNVQAMSYIIDNVREIVKPILEKYSSEGDVEKFCDISVFLPDFSLINLGFNFYFCKAFIVSGKHELLLSQLEQRIDKKNKLFSSIAFEELLKFPEYEDRIFNLAINYLKTNIHLPMALIWAFHFKNGNFEKADEIMKNYPFQYEKTDCLLKYIRQDENVALALKYVDFVKPVVTLRRVKERAYGAALDLLVRNEMHDQAAALVVESEKLGLQLRKYYARSLTALKNALEKDNKPVLFSISLDGVSDSSSDSE